MTVRPPGTGGPNLQSSGLPPLAALGVLLRARPWEQVKLLGCSLVPREKVLPRSGPPGLSCAASESPRRWAEGDSARAREPTLPPSASGTYSVKCYDCETINDFNCPKIRVCDYEVRRCLTVSIRKYLLVSLTPCEPVTLLGGSRGQGHSATFSAPTHGPWLVRSPSEQHVVGTGLSPQKAVSLQRQATCSAVGLSGDTSPAACPAGGNSATPQGLHSPSGPGHVCRSPGQPG